MLSSVSTELKANPQNSQATLAAPLLWHGVEWREACEDLAIASWYSMFCVEKMPALAKRAALKPEWHWWVLINNAGYFVFFHARTVCKWERQLFIDWGIAAQAGRGLHPDTSVSMIYALCWTCGSGNMRHMCYCLISALCQGRTEAEEWVISKGKSISKLIWTCCLMWCEGCV